jgi:phospholipid/cholesterol/gamma-HCH transport system ATP-binding protein
MIEFKNVSLSIDDRQILKNITMEVLPGNTLVIVGGSGSGKTTILRLILGLIRPDSGQILIDGKDITKIEEKEMAPIRSKMALVFQGSALFDSLSVGENVGYRLWEQGLLDEEAIELKVMESLRFVGLDDIVDHMPAELSGGMKKRVAIARALASHPEVILFDEPTAGLDPVNTYIIKELICRLHTKEHVTQVVVTHDIETAYRVADHLIMIQLGEEVFNGTLEELKASTDNRIQAFLHPEAVLTTPACFVHKDENFGIAPEKLKDLPRSKLPRSR